MADVFIGSQAVRSGQLTGYQLRTDFQSIYQDVYLPKCRAVSLRDRTVGAWLWSKQRATIAGLSAAALHGAQWVDDDIPDTVLDRPFTAGRQASRRRPRCPPTPRITTACRRRRRITEGDVAASAPHRRRLPETDHADPDTRPLGAH